MNYGKFAYLYDELMQDVPYDRWVSVVLEKKNKYDIKGNKLLDLACGTGELSVRFLRAGFDVTGVDLSSDMLAVAQNKSNANGYQITLFEQNMAELELNQSFDVIGIFCDSLNYLKNEEDVIQTFQQVYKHLETGGLFIFDVHSVFKVEEIFMDQTFTYDEENITYIWNCFQSSYPNSVDHELTFFVRDERSNKYDRYDEFHTQRTFPIETYQEWAEMNGFEVLEITADFEDTVPDEESERVFFILRKP